MEKRDNTDKDDVVVRVYEVGYHILPTVSEEDLPAVVGDIKGMLEGNGALFISEEFPKLRPLAYTLSKELDGKKNDFDQAYFGWVKFEVGNDAIVSVKKSLDANRNVLRFLLIETVRENTMSFIRPAYRRDDEKTEGGEEKPQEEQVPVDEEKVNQAIDELVKE